MEGLLAWPEEALTTAIRRRLCLYPIMLYLGLPPHPPVQCDQNLDEHSTCSCFSVHVGATAAARAYCLGAVVLT